MTPEEAIVNCMVRGYIYREKYPHVHFWKNSHDFNLIIAPWKLENDWLTHDPKEGRTE